MATALDDYAIHQIVENMELVEGRNPRWTDELWFHASSVDGKLTISAHIGVYPQTATMDAAVSVAIGDKQYNVRASRVVDGDRDTKQVDCISAEIIDPFKELTWAKAHSTTELLKKAKELEEKSCVMLAQIEKNVRDKTLVIQQKAQEIRLKALEQAQISIEKERVKNEDFIKSFCADLKQQKKEQMPLVVEQSQKIAKEALVRLLQK